MLYQTPYGNLTYQISATGALRTLQFLPANQPLATLPLATFETAAQAAGDQQFRQELAAYFAHRLKKFTIPLELNTGTPFQQLVWQALQEIPYGETCSYSDIATAIGNPKAVRAIGQANRANPLALVIPCHRVIGKNGKLFGYMGNTAEGRQLKLALLAHEKKH